MACTQCGVLVAVLLAVVAPASAKDYAVGGASGWKPGVDYTAWAKDKSFNVGDSLSFQYSTGHTVEEVSEADYKACSASNALGSYKEESTSIPLTKPGTRYFICGASGHCAAGMKLAITISDPTAPATTTTASPTARSTNRPSAGSDSDSDDESGAAGSPARLVTGLLCGVMGLAALMG
ncbi:hypothetical protein PR202_ga19493 [Eleusine coracana subsp. coracana]|uniref:Phytocyanin domain-containing protein n=1 Tax=Eleusine coracana subsp. coracana TaxID=191504 RepID=A0AAV5CUW2_ELECO|nr:hypothetical protein PR202_ga19493 [Eleusine coracana subsp. coracana]